MKINNLLKNVSIVVLGIFLVIIPEPLTTAIGIYLIIKGLKDINENNDNNVDDDLCCEILSKTLTFL